MENKLFNAINLGKLNNPERLKWMPPGKMWNLLGISNPQKLADIGAGSGYITEEFGKILPDVEIYALDIQKTMVSYMEANVKTPVYPLLMTGGKIPLEDGVIDALWTIAVYHEVADVDLFLQEIKRILKPHGRVLIVDWDKSKDACEKGPKYDHRVETFKVVDDLIKSGFKNVEVHDDLQWHFAVTATV